jgi:predicted DNA-binding antitoxin AbrB/MazE fold protein
MWGRLAMVKTIEAVYDGAVFHPADPLVLEPNIRVRLTIQTVPQVSESAGSFLRVARSLDLDGPADWATNLEAYLYDREGLHDE